MKKKFKLTEESENLLGVAVYRIKALRSFGIVKKGDLGGFVEHEENLSHDGDCWIFNNATALGNSRVTEDAKMFGDALIDKNVILRGRACICDESTMTQNAIAQDDAKIYGASDIHDNVIVKDKARVYEEACLAGNALLSDNARVFGDAIVKDNAKIMGGCVYEQAVVGGDCTILGKVRGAARVMGNVFMDTNTKVEDEAEIDGDVKILDNALVGGKSKVSQMAEISGKAMVLGESVIKGFAKVYGMVKVVDSSACDCAELHGDRDDLYDVARNKHLHGCDEG